MTAPIPIDALGRMSVLGDGAYGVVHQLHRYRLAGLPPLAFKRFKRPPAPERIANLVELVAARAAMSDHDRRLLDASTTWPVQLVTDGVGVCGFVMPLLDEAFMADLHPRAGVSERRPRSAQWLVVGDGKVRAAGVSVPAAADLPTRLLLCARVAHTLGVLHRHGLVFGDLSYNNVVFTAGRHRPRTVLVDCDGVRTAATPRLAQEHSPDWWPPENRDGSLPPGQQDAATDRYKLALLILRVLTPGETASVTTDPQRAAAVLDADGLRMLRAGLGEDREARPTAKQWFVHLVDLAGALTHPPSIGDLTVDPPVVLAGEHVRLSWRSRGAQLVEIHASDGTVHRPAAGQSTVTVPVQQPGPLTVTAANDYGRATRRSPHVFVVTPPRIDRIRLPEPPLPTVNSATAALADRLSGALRAARFDVPLHLPELPLSAGTGRDLLAGTTVADWLRDSAPSATALLAALTPSLPVPPASPTTPHGRRSPR